MDLDQKNINLDRICRCCLIERANMKSIFDACLSDMLMLCANISIASTDSLPSLICFQCVQDVNRSYTFRQQCERSDTMLRNWFKPSISTATDTKDPAVVDEAIEEMGHEEPLRSSSNGKIINVLLECVNNAVKSTIMVPIDEHGQIQLDQLDEATYLQLTSIDSAAIIGQRLPSDQPKQETNSCPVIMTTKDISLLPELPKNDNILLNDPSDRETDLDMHHNDLSTLIHSNDVPIGTHDSPLQDQDIDIGCNVGGQEEFINVEFLNNKMTIIPDTYMEMINTIGASQAQSNDLAETKAIDTVENQLKPYKCDVCEKSFRIKGLLRKHQQLHVLGDKKDFVCDYCSQQFINQSGLNKHLKRHIGDKKHKCTMCQKSFYENNILKIHMRTHTGERPYSCDECPKRFAQINQLKSHKFTHSEEKNFSCEICSKRFTLQWQLKLHMRIHTSDKPYECSECDKKFTQSGNLELHRRVHSGDRPYACTDCDKRFVSSSQLTVHLRQHTGIRPEAKIECTICGKKTITNSELKIHMRSHNGERPHQCDICFRRFSMHTHLVVHVRSHTGEKPYKCTMCDKSFTTGSLLKKHIYMHTGEKPYPCQHCDKNFSQPGARNTHQKTHFKVAKIKKSKIKEEIIDDDAEY